MKLETTSGNWSLPGIWLRKVFKSIPPNLMVRWRNNTDAMIEAQYPTPGEFEYMECGPSPPAESAPSMYDSFEEPTSELSVQICNDTLRISLIDQMKNAAGRIRYFEDIEQGNVIAESTKTHFESSSKIEKNLCFLWSAFLKRWDLLQSFLDIGAELNFYDQNGITALHLGAFSNCLSTLSCLVGKGMNVNFQPKCYTPLHCAAFGNSAEAAKFLINNGAHTSIDTNKPNCEESLLHCAVRANALECLQIFIDEGADVNSLKPNGTNAIHLSADLGNAQCLEALLKAPGADPNVRICIREKESTALHLAADEGNVECVNLLLVKGADAKLKNHRGFTALHLAARTSSLECVESLLRNGNADPNAEDFDHRTPLHAAIGKSENAFDILETLIQWGANVNHKDIYGFTALHLAALDGLAQCVEMLIYHGADVTTKSKKGTSALNVITRKTPASVAMIRQKLDAAITLHHSQDPVNREVELELDFRQLLQHCHPREISYLNTFVDEVSPQAYRVVLCVKPLNPSEKRLPRDILMKAYEVGKMRKHFGHTISAKNSATYLSYKNKYNNDSNQTPTTPYATEDLEATLIGSLTTKIDDNTDRIEYLTQEIQELRQALVTQQQQASKVIDKLLIVISNQQKNNLRR
uniref:ANK_REP_REGION domain-containing protein n=1 Tax=Glossina austeni TaxID=7395 RepID=A0A1A9V0E9_GLOAU